MRHVHAGGHRVKYSPISVKVTFQRYLREPIMQLGAISLVQYKVIEPLTLSLGR
jgi:hypothetical protein